MICPYSTFGDSAVFDALAGLANLMAEYASDNSSRIAEPYDFAPLLSALSQKTAFIGSGRASGDQRAFEAANLALAPLLPARPLSSYSSVIINITAADDVTMTEYHEVCEYIMCAVSSGEDGGPNVHTFLSLDNSFGPELRVLVMAADTSSDCVQRR